MANCVQNFKQILNNRTFQTRLRRALSTVFEGSKLNTNSEVLDPMITELSKFIIDKSAERNSINTYSFNDFKSKLSDVIYKIKGDTVISEDAIDKFITLIKESVEDSLIKKNLDSNPKINGEPLFDISEMSKATFDNEAYNNYLKGLTNEGLFKAIFINSISTELGKDLPYESFVVNDNQLNTNLTLYKEELWRYIYGYYKEKTNKTKDISLYDVSRLDDGSYSIKLNEDLFIQAEDGSTMYSNILSFVKDQMLNNIKVNSQDLSIFNDQGHSLAQAYLKALVLSNFDTILHQEHADKVSVNIDKPNSYNLPTNSDPKYKAHFSWSAKTKGYDEVYSDIADYTSSITKLIANLIPFCQKVNGRWRTAPHGLTVGLTDLNSIGALLNSLPNEFVVNFENKRYTIPQLFLEYDKGTMSFNQILELLIGEDSDKNNNLLGRKNVLYSLKRFLYGNQGVAIAVKKWRSENPSLADQIVNPETVIINQIRNTVKHTYLQTNIDGKSTLLDHLDIDSASIYDFEDLIRNIDHRTKYFELKSSYKNKINTVSDYIKFLKEECGISISDSTLKNFLEARQQNNKPFNNDWVKSKTFREAFDKLFPLIQSTLNTREIAENLMNDSDVEAGLGLRTLFLAAKRSTKYRIVTQIKKAQGTSAPTMGIANLSLLFNIAIEKAPSSNFFKTHPGLYKQTTALSELVSGDKAIDFFDANYKEIFKAQFIKHFIETRINREEQIIMPFNTSDKKSIPGIVISTEALFNGKTLGELSSNEVKTEMFNAQKSYYINLINSIYKDYQILDPDFFKNTNDKIGRIEKYFDKISEDAKKSGKSVKGLLQEKVNRVFNDRVDKEGNKIPRQYLDLTEDLHYSLYKGGSVKFNQQLKAYYQLFTNKPLFDAWAERLESKLIEGIGFESIPLSQVNISSERIDKVKTINDTFGEGSAILDPNDEDKINYILKIGNNGKPTEILKKFLWSKNLIISQYVNTTVKETFLHPAKTKFESIDLSKGTKEQISANLELLAKEEHARTTVFTKRMNVPGASITIYGKGKEGILLNHKVAVFSDPSTAFFNPEGQVEDQKVYDGGGFMNPFFNELLKKSLPGYGLKSSQKPLAESISDKASATFKFATYSISNEEMRISTLSDKPHQMLMKKLNSFDIWDGNFRNLFEIHDQRTNSSSQINISEMFPNYYMEYKGQMRKVQNVNWETDTNKYSIIFDDGEEKKFKVDNLYDLWEGFGGEYSAQKDNDGTYSYNENSIQLVSSIMSLQAMSGGIELRDKMIVMALPETNVKKGVTNSNSYSTLHSNKELSYFNFDTSFFGVQLDASHDTDESKINEITQVISLITEKAAVPELYNSVYDAISYVVESGLKKFKLNISNDDKFKKLVDKFVFRLNHSSQINNAKVIINGLEQDAVDLLPLDDKTIYKQFVSYIISETNAEFVRRKFSGSASVMRPSYGIIQLFEDKTEKKYFADDLIKLFDRWDADDREYSRFKEELYTKNLAIRDLNQAKINWILANKHEFKSDIINHRAIRPLSHITLNTDIELMGKKIPAGQLITLKEYEDFYRLKDILEANPKIQVQRVYTKPRDLKPVDITFTQVYKGFDVLGKPTTIVDRSVWDTASHRFKFELNFKKKEILAGTHQRYNQFVEYIKTIDPRAASEADSNEMYNIVVAYANKWLERTYSLLRKGKTEIDYVGKENPFFKIFLKEDGTYDNFIGRFEDNYRYTVPISHYKHRNPENVHSNINKSSFGLGEKYSIGLSDAKDFTLSTKDIQFSTKLPYDVMFYNTLTKEQRAVIIDGINYVVKDGNLYNRYVIEQKENPIPLAHEIEINKSIDGKYRLDAFGNKMYKLPENYKIFENNRGEEIIVITGNDKFDDFKNFVDNDGSFDYIHVKPSGYNTVDKLTGIIQDDYEQLLNIISENAHGYQLKHLFDIQLAEYQKFKKTVEIKKPEESEEEPNKLSKKEVMDAYMTYISSTQSRNISNYLNKLAMERYNSFKLSLENICARIPAQALQSVMSMNTIGFIQGNANDVYVSHWQLTLQGSDYDIDKLYMMGYSFKNGRFLGWSPYFTMNDFELSRQLPLPRGKIYNMLNSDVNTIIFEPGRTIEQKVDLNDPNIFNLDKKLEEIESSRKVIMGTSYTPLNPLERLIRSLNILNEGDYDLDYEFVYSKDKKLTDKINKHESYYSEDGFKNFIVDKLHGVLTNPETQVSSSKPTSFGVYSKFKSKIEDKSFQLNNYDGNTSGKQQEQNSIGKEVIGIAATGLKNYFALIRYFKNYYDQLKGRSLSVEDPEFFKSTYTINGKVYNLGRIAGLFSSESIIKQQNELMAKTVKDILERNPEYLKGSDEKKAEQINKIVDDVLNFTEDSDAALTISSILSLATDNAKELLLSKINAGVDFAGMHIYMIMLGIDPETVTNFMIDPRSLALKESLQTDMFESTFNKNILDKIIYYMNTIDTEKNPSDWEHVYNFYNIFTDSKDLVSLGSMLKVNQGSKATEEELSKMLNTVKYSLITQMKAFDKRMNVTSVKPRELVKNIQIHKPYLSLEYINSALADAAKYHLFEGPLNMDRFFGESYEDIAYHDAAIKAYNLIKFSFNTLDVLDKSNHFKSMFNAFTASNSLITEKTNKRYFIESSKQVLDKIAEIDKLDFNIVKNIKLNGKLENPSEYNPKILSAVSDYLDNRLILSFFKNEGIVLDLQALCNRLGIKEIQLLDDDPQNIRYTSYNVENLPSNLKELSVTNQYGLAVFKQIMEAYIIPLAKREHINNGFLKQYVMTSYLSYNLKHKMSYYNDVNNAADLEQLELGINEIIGKGKNKNYDSKTGETVDSYSYGIKVNDDGNLTNIGFMDLLTMYNLITNEGRFGGDRASNLFYRDLDVPSSISQKFINFEANFSHDQVDDLVKTLMDDEDSRNIFLLKVFGQTDMKSNLKSTEVTISSSPEAKAQSMSVNRYYGFIESNALDTNVISTADYVDEIVKLLRANNILPEKNCN